MLTICLCALAYCVNVSYFRVLARNLIDLTMLVGMMGWRDTANRNFGYRHEKQLAR